MKTTKLMIGFACLAMVVSFCIIALAYGQEESELTKTYKAVTEGYQVGTTGEVIVEEITIIERKVTWSLDEIDEYIKYYQMQIKGFESQAKDLKDAISKLQELKVKIGQEAAKIELKPANSDTL